MKAETMPDALSVPCQKCGAKEGEACKTGLHESMTIHNVRRATASGSKPEKITFNMVKEADGRCGVECSACGDRFFDLKSKGVRPRLLTSCIELAVAHAKEKHESLRSEVPSGVCRGKRGKPDASH